jgi:hypothetical protein
MQNGAATVRHGRFDVRRAGGICLRIGPAVLLPPPQASCQAQTDN